MEGRSPLEGLKVVDLSPDPTGAQVSQVLSDFGAEVVWIEPPGGSRLRRQSSFPFLARGKIARDRITKGAFQELFPHVPPAPSDGVEVPET